MINVTTKRFYFQPKQKKSIPLNTLGLAAGGLAFHRFLQRQRPQLYLNDPSQVFIVSLIVASIVVGLLLLWMMVFLIKKKYQPQFKDYIKSKPRPKEIENIHDKKKILDTAQAHALIALLVCVGFLIWSISAFNRFMTDENLETYISAMIPFLFSLALFSVIDRYVFILKLTVKDIRT